MSRQKEDTNFRASVRLLINKGLLSPSIDLRKVTPETKIADGKATNLRSSNTLQKLIDRHDNIISGKASVFDVSKVSDAGYKKLYEKSTVGGKQFIIVPHSADETVKLDHGKIVISHPAGIDRVQVPVEYQNLEQYISDSTKVKIGKQGKPYFAFRFYGGSSNVFRTLPLLLDELRQYQLIDRSIRRGDASLQRDIFRNLEIVTVKSGKKWFEQREKNKAVAKRKRREPAKKTTKKRSNRK